jgi:hypothetical protein
MRLLMLQLLSLLGFFVGLTHAIDRLELVLLVNDANRNEVANAVADGPTILQKWVGMEGSGYVAIAPGQVFPARRGLGKLVDGGNHFADEEEAQRRELYSTCSSSIGCTTCSRCGRRLQGSKQRKIESNLGLDLTKTYCGGKPTCVITAIINSVLDDGTIIRAP